MNQKLWLGRLKQKVQDSKKIRLVTWHNVSKIMYSLKKSQFNTVKDRIETLISCSKDKFGPEKKETEFNLMEKHMYSMCF